MSNFKRFLKLFEANDTEILKDINPDSPGGNLVNNAYHAIKQKNATAAQDFVNKAKQVKDMAGLDKLKKDYYSRYGAKDIDNIYESGYIKGEKPKSKWEGVINKVRLLEFDRTKNLRFPTDAIYDEEHPEYNSVPEEARYYVTVTDEIYRDLVKILDRMGATAHRVNAEETETGYIKTKIAKSGLRDRRKRSHEMIVDVFRSQLWSVPTEQLAWKIISEVNYRNPEVLRDMDEYFEPYYNQWGDLILPFEHLEEGKWYVATTESRAFKYVGENGDNLVFEDNKGSTRIYSKDTKFTPYKKPEKKSVFMPLPKYMTMGNGPARNVERINHIKATGRPSEYEN